MRTQIFKLSNQMSKSYLIGTVFFIATNLTSFANAKCLIQDDVKTLTTSILPSNFHISEEAAFLHFIDTISEWSPVCNAKGVDYKFLGVPEPTTEDKAQLARYAKARFSIGMESEIDLFLWAENAYSPDKNDINHLTIKSVMKYFHNKQEYYTPLRKRVKELHHIAPIVAKEAQSLDTRVVDFDGVTRVFSRPGTIRWNNVPVFLFFTFKKHSAQGGANGPGMYTEIDPDASPDAVRNQCVLFLHEALHISLRPRETFLEFTKNVHHPLGKTWHQALQTIASDEGGDIEAAMLDEILVYTLTNVLIGGDSPSEKVKYNQNRNNKQGTRLWNGVQILLPIVKAQIKNPQMDEQFLIQIFENFVSHIHCEKWKMPIQ